VEIYGINVIFSGKGQKRFFEEKEGRMYAFAFLLSQFLHQMFLSLRSELRTILVHFEKKQLR